MAHFAKLNESSIVIEVNSVNNAVLDAENEESSGIEFLVAWSDGHTNWKQTSYNGNFRKNYAGIGYLYDPIRDAFIPPKPFPSWILNEETCLWEAPINKPNDDKYYIWNEENSQWTEVLI